MKEFSLGLLAMASAVAAMFFFRYWKITGERLFVFFALAFGALTLNWLGLSRLHPTLAAENGVYLVRLLAFALILAGIADKNRRDRRP